MRIEARIDWIQFTFPILNSVDFRHSLDYFEAILNDSFEIHFGTGVVHGRRWENSGESVKGCLLAFDSLGKRISKGWISIPGSVLAGVNQIKLFEMLKRVVLWDGKVTRIDIALDDYDKSIEPNLVVEAFDQKNVAGFKYFDPRFPKYLGSDDCGWCLYFGSTKSDKRVRYYNKSVESEGKIDAYRWEAQFRGDRANSLVMEMASAISITEEHALAEFLSGCVVGAIDFVDRASGDRLSRCKRLAWWNCFVSKIGAAIRIGASRAIEPIQKSFDWIDKQVSTTLAMIDEYFSNDEDSFYRYIFKRVSEGRKRLSHRHRKILELSGVPC